MDLPRCFVEPLRVRRLLPRRPNLKITGRECVHKLISRLLQISRSRIEDRHEQTEAAVAAAVPAPLAAAAAAAGGSDRQRIPPDHHGPGLHRQPPTDGTWGSGRALCPALCPPRRLLRHPADRRVLPADGGGAWPTTADYCRRNEHIRASPVAARPDCQRQRHIC